jgi:hypothetical protein
LNFRNAAVVPSLPHRQTIEAKLLKVTQMTTWQIGLSGLLDLELKGADAA